MCTCCRFSSIWIYSTCTREQTINTTRRQEGTYPGYTVYIHVTPFLPSRTYERMISCHRAIAIERRTMLVHDTTVPGKYECNASLGHDQYLNFPSGDQIIRKCDPCTFVPGCSAPDRSEAVYIAYCTTTLRTTSACMSTVQLVQQDHARYGTCCTRLCPEM